MKTYLSLLVVLFAAISFTACTDDSSSEENNIPELGTLTMTLADTTWNSTSTVAYAGSIADSSAAVITAIHMQPGSQEVNSYLSLIAVNMTSPNLRGTYTMVPDEEETELTKAAVALFFDADGGFWVSTSGEFIITSTADNVLKGTFEGVLTEAVFEEEEDVVAKMRRGIQPKFQLGTRQLNTTVVMSDGGFHTSYSDFEDEVWE